MKRDPLEMNKPRKYKNPLAQEIAHASSAMNDLLDDSVISVQGAVAGGGIPNSMLLSILIYLGARREKKTPSLLKQTFNNSNQLLADYKKNSLDLGNKTANPYEESIEKEEVVNSIQDFVSALENTIAATNEKIFSQKIMSAVPDEFISESNNPIDRVIEYIKFIKEETQGNLNKTIPEYVYQLKGDYWEIRFSEKMTLLKDSKGLHYIYTLLQNPHQYIRVDTLAISDSALPSQTGGSLYKENNTATDYSFISNADTSVYNDAIKILEENQELVELGSNEYYEIDEKIRMLKADIKRRFNRSGIERPEDQGEKARQSVLKAISRDRLRIKKRLPNLFVHLENHIRTGYECIYNPPTEEIKSWQFKA